MVGYKRINLLNLENNIDKIYISKHGLIIMRFRFVDKILQYKVNEYIEGIKAVSLEEHLLLERLGTPDRFPPILMAESIFQLGNFLIYKSFKNKLAILSMFNKIRIHNLLTAGDVMVIRADIVGVIGESVRLNGCGYVNGKEVISGEGCIGNLVDIEKLYDPDEFAVFFERLCR